MHTLFPKGVREGAFMKGWMGKTWIGCVLTLGLSVSVAHADGGTITFSGAVMAPTCSARTGDIDAAASPHRASGTGNALIGCGDARAPGTAGATSTSSYVLTVEPLESSALSSDRLVAYFSGYVKAAGQPDTRMNLVTQAYE